MFNCDTFSTQTDPLSLVIDGQVVVNPDVPAEAIEAGLKELVVMTGPLVYPRHLAGVIQSKLTDFSGMILTYTAPGRISMGRLILSPNELHSLDDETDLIVIGNMNIPRVLENELLAQKVLRLQVTGTIVCHEENAQTLFVAMDRTTVSPEVTTIPTGFELVEKPLVLSAALLEALPQPKLYCTKRILIEKDVEVAALDSRLEALIATDKVICPATLNQVLLKKCNRPETEILFYSGDLMLVDEELTLYASRFEYLPDKLTLVVDNELRMAKDVDPQMIVDRVAAIHNFDEIRCTPEQMGAIQSVLGINDGELLDSTRAKPGRHETVEEGIRNVGYLAL